MKQKKPMTLSDHIRLAVRIELARLSLMSGFVDILQYHGREHKREYRRIAKAINAIEELKDMMDNIVCAEKPDGIGDACAKVYYDVDDSLGYSDELDSVLETYDVRHAMHLLTQKGRTIDADEIVLTKFDSSHADLYDEERNGDKFLHVNSDLKKSVKTLHILAFVNDADETEEE